jgi:two-component sensor histidine kinase
VLEDLEILDTPADPDFDRLTRLAAGLFGAQMSAVALVDGRREWFKSRFGTATDERPLGFAAYLTAADEPSLVVLDATADERFSVQMRGEVAFYAGAAIIVHGERLGGLCVMDPQPRSSVEPRLVEELVDLAGVAASLLELKHEAKVRARTAAELIKEEWRHALTLEAGKVGSYVWDIATGEVVANDIMRRMYGFDPVKRLTIEEFFAVIDPADVPVVQAAIDTTFEDGVDYVAEFRVRSGRWLSGRGRVYQRDAKGRPLVMMGVNIDITEARQAADHTRHLLRELNHRVKNTLAMTQSLARQTLKQSPDPQDFLDAFSGRLRTLADAHALLADRDWAGIGLVELVDSQVGPYAIRADDRLTIEGEDVQLPPDHALGLGIILHELASNAARFGALSTDKGRVRIAWQIANGEVHLDWVETGGPPVGKKRDIGFGSRLIQRSLDKILGSSVSLEFPPTGVEAHIAFPLA